MKYVVALETQVDLYKLHNSNCSVETTFLSTHSKYGRKGIGRALIEQTIRLAAELKQGNGESVQCLPEAVRSLRPGFVLIMFSSIYSQRIGKQLGFVTHATAPYAKHKFRGETLESIIGNPLHKGLDLTSLAL